MPAVGNRSNLSSVLLSLTVLLRVCPMHTWFRSQPESWAEFTQTTWGSPCLISPFWYSPFTFRSQWSLQPLSSVTQARKIAVFIRASAVLCQVTSAAYFQVKAAKNRQLILVTVPFSRYPMLYKTNLPFSLLKTFR